MSSENRWHHIFRLISRNHSHEWAVRGMRSHRRDRENVYMESSTERRNIRKRETCYELF